MMIVNKNYPSPIKSTHNYKKQGYKMRLHASEKESEMDEIKLEDEFIKTLASTLVLQENEIDPKIQENILNVLKNEENINDILSKSNLHVEEEIDRTRIMGFL